MAATIIEIILVALVLIAIIKEEQLIAWERKAGEKVLDFFVWCCAQVINGYRYAKWWVSGVKR